ncbi:phosphodiester glycosidase family protein [Profundibacterium mesophilum]|uniref:Periplasmic protein n=1 Tax=Profundibacterium mesophilum KAUST100406-0324 TaxID=1037889 RepID=A0A921NXJ5_9RHOB|nr:phosphodiester glycosidase family protein [Profundibacterium mesophilum]KAF0676569.1 putative periplasmic protein [Profundibacterium mesophilum KAUST100406-0324]
MLRRAALLLLALGAPALAEDAGEGGQCRKMRFEGTQFTACAVDMERETLRLWLDGPDGRPFGSFSALDAHLERGGERLGIAMNGGMYHPDRTPVGHYVEDGQEAMRVVTSEGPGNFGLLPNGVLCLQPRRAAILESRAFAAQEPDCLHATQSGPMLVLDGALHPRFIEDSDSLNLRNGVGVRDGGRTVWLAMSDGPVNFHGFARFFRDVLGTPDALYLDGSVSKLYAPQMGRRDIGLPMGPILGTAVPAG